MLDLAKIAQTWNEGDVALVYGCFVRWVSEWLYRLDIMK